MGRKWSNAEDEMLAELVTVYGKQWGLIASHMGDRSAAQVSARWEKCLDPRLTKGSFTEEEDRIIIDYVEQNGPHNWPGVAEILANRSPKQCRERWVNHLDPAVVSAPWTREEDMTIFDHVQRMGCKWSFLSKVLDGRTDNAIKNRWNSSVSKRIEIDASGRRILQPDLPRRGRRPPVSAGHKPPPIRTAASKVRMAQAPEFKPPPIRTTPQKMRMEDPFMTLPAQPPPEAIFQPPFEAVRPSPVSPFGLFRSPTTPMEFVNVSSSGTSTPWSTWDKWSRAFF
jgi:hypothetical protein